MKHKYIKVRKCDYDKIEKFVKQEHIGVCIFDHTDDIICFNNVSSYVRGEDDLLDMYTSNEPLKYIDDMYKIHSIALELLKIEHFCVDINLLSNAVDKYDERLLTNKDENFKYTSNSGLVLIEPKEGSRTSRDIMFSNMVKITNEDLGGLGNKGCFYCSDTEVELRVFEGIDTAGRGICNDCLSDMNAKNHINEMNLIEWRYGFPTCFNEILTNDTEKPYDTLETKVFEECVVSDDLWRNSANLVKAMRNDREVRFESILQLLKFPIIKNEECKKIQYDILVSYLRDINFNEDGSPSNDDTYYKVISMESSSKKEALENVEAFVFNSEDWCGIEDDYVEDTFEIKSMLSEVGHMIT